MNDVGLGRAGTGGASPLLPQCACDCSGIPLNCDDLEAMGGTRYNSEDARMAGFGKPDDVTGITLAGVVRSSIGSKAAKETMDRLRNGR